MKEGYIPPYNYCNYRCEKCCHLGKCRLASMELVREAELVAEGKDPQDQSVVWDEAKRNFEDALIMLRKMAAEEGVSLEEEALKADSSAEPETFPLVEVIRTYPINAPAAIPAFRLRLRQTSQRVLNVALWLRLRAFCSPSLSRSKILNFAFEAFMR